MARFELAGDTAEGWLEASTDAIAFWTRRGTDAAIERMRAQIDTDGYPDPHEDDVRQAYVTFQRNHFAGGWRRVPDLPREVVHTEPREPALEAALLDPGADASAWSVYADWFQERGHPRGELIALQLRGEIDPAFMARGEAATRGMLAPLVTSYALRLGWWRGFFRSAVVTTAHPLGAGEDVLWELLRHPSARLLRRLEIQGWIGNAELYTDVLLHTQAPPLRELLLGPTGITRGPLPQLGDLGRLGERYPRLDDVELHGTAGLRGLRLPNARRFALDTRNLRRTTLADVFAAVGSELETLELHFGLQSECGPSDLAPLCDGTLRLPGLHTLHLTGLGFADEACAMLARSAVLRQLDTLDLSSGRLTDRGVAELRAVHGDLRLHTHGTAASAAHRADTTPPRR